MEAQEEMTNETSEAIFEKYREWVTLSEEERKGKGLPVLAKEFAIAHGVSQATLSRWGSQLREVEPEVAKRKALNQAFLKRQYKLGMTGKHPKSAEIYAKSQGLLIDKKEIKQEITLGANDYHNIAERTIQSLRDNYKQFGGTCPVCGKSTPLPESVLLDNKQEHSQSS